MDKWPVHLNTVVVRHTLFVPKGNTMFTQNDCESRRISLFFHRPMNGKHVRSHSPISDVKRHITRTHTHYITSLSYSCNSEPVLKYPSSHETRPWHIISPSMSGTFRLRKTISPKRSETRRNFRCMDQWCGAGTCSQKQRVYVSSGNG